MSRHELSTNGRVVVDGEEKRQEAFQASHLGVSLFPVQA